jgi:NADPH:quinone reductase-like Zn-dependent oxidoreductase
VVRVLRQGAIAGGVMDRGGGRTRLSGAQLREITRLVDQGVVRPQVGAVYPLAEAREALMAKSTQHVPGKVVLTP